MYLLYDLTILLLTIFPKYSILNYRYIFSFMFLSALFKITRKLKHPRSISTDEWIMKHIYRFYSNMKMKLQNFQVNGQI